MKYNNKIFLKYLKNINIVVPQSTNVGINKKKKILYEGILQATIDIYKKTNYMILFNPCLLGTSPQSRRNLL